MKQKIIDWLYEEGEKPIGGPYDNPLYDEWVKADFPYNYNIFLAKKALEQQAKLLKAFVKDNPVLIAWDNPHAVSKLNEFMVLE